MASEVSERVRKHLEHCDLYFANAREALGKDEVTKAGEMLWGSVTQAFHALASVRGTEVETHRRLKNFANRTSQEVGNPDVLGGFLAAEILHKGFYDINVELDDIEGAVPLVRRTIDLVTSLIPSDLKDGSQIPS